ncbi:MAG: Asp-tRNA(Asn)/Glu-tRNA(Gln) amidotransferase subunit GatC [Gemmatimonadaceae bacterium]
MAVQEADVRKIADLARLSISGSELPEMTAQLNNILAHMDELTHVDAQVRDPSVAATAAGAPLRDDVVAPIPMNSTAQLLAPDSRDGFILVPRLGTHEDL